MTLPFDPIDEAARQWGKHWDRVPAMHAVTSLMRVQQLVIGRLDALLKPHGLTFARYEALVLLVFSSRGSLPLGKMGERLQVHPTSVTSIVRRLEAAGLVVRRAHPEDGRAVLAEITPEGRALVERATQDLVETDFALGALSDSELQALSALLASGAQGGRGLLAMVTADDVRAVGLALPRTYEFFTGGRYKLKVKQIVYVGFSKDETLMGFGYPKDARDGLIESDPETFFLPPARGPALPVGVRAPGPAGRRRDARAGRRRVADVHAEDAARPPGHGAADGRGLERDRLGGVARRSAAAAPVPALHRR